MRIGIVPPRMTLVVLVTVAGTMVPLLSCISCGRKETPASNPAAGRTASAFVNSRCPIMAGRAIDPGSVPENLTREYKGRKVAFCCGICPAAWDKLTDSERDAKLEKAK